MSDLKKKIRPAIPSIIEKAHITVEEKFQNDVLRPIIKLQNDLILSCFEYYLKRIKVDILKLNIVQKANLIEKSFKRDAQLKVDMRSLIIGLFTFAEYKEYLNISAQLNKRINSIIQERVGNAYLQKDK